MGKYILKRLLFVIPPILVATFIIFILMNFTNLDPAEATLHAQGYPVITPEMIAHERTVLGLDKPFLVRYVIWLWNCVKLDFGLSYTHKIPVLQLVMPALGNTLRLTLVTTAFVVGFALFFGTICAVYSGSWVDRIIRTIIVSVGSMPSFWIGMILLVFVLVKMDILPTGGIGGPSFYILPVLVLIIANMKFHFRLIRNAMIENRSKDYVLYCRACGMTDKMVVRHILRNSLQTAVAAMCMAIPNMIAGSFIVENLFSWPGIGRLCIGAIENRDIPIIQSYVVVVAFAFIITNILGDIINAVLDPKLRGE